MLDVPVEVSEARLASRCNNVDRIESESRAFHERVRSGFLVLSKLGPRYHVLDGSLEPGALVDYAMSALAEYVA